MVLECTSLCLLAITVGLKASADTQKCSYCMDVRALTIECDKEPLRCAYGANADPNSLIYCLTVVEVPWQSMTARRVVRCVSHTIFNLTLIEFRQAALLRECQFDVLRECDCPNCRYSHEERNYDEQFSSLPVIRNKTTSTSFESLDEIHAETDSLPLFKSIKIHRISDTITNQSRTKLHKKNYQQHPKKTIVPRKMISSQQHYHLSHNCGTQFKVFGRVWHCINFLLVITISIKILLL